MRNVVNDDQVTEIVEEIAEELAELVILAEYAKSGERLPKGKAYQIEIDRTEKLVHVHGMTGGQILDLIGKSSDQWALQMKLHGGKRERIEPGKYVEFHAHRIERFETSPKRVRNGEATQNAVLAADDVDFLNSLALIWEVLTDDTKAQALVIHSFPLPKGADRQNADLMIRLPATYPAAELDMFNLPRGVGRAESCLLMAKKVGLADRWSPP